MKRFTVYVPAPESDLRLTIAGGSGIVGSAAEGSGNVVIDYEGNLYGSSSFVTFADKLYHAAGRHVWREEDDGTAHRYPTIARAVVAVDELVEIGIYDWDEGELTLDEDSEAVLAEWLGVSEVDRAELLTASSSRHQIRREVRAALASGDPRKRQLAREMSRRYQLDLV